MTHIEELKKLQSQPSGKVPVTIVDSRAHVRRNPEQEKNEQRKAELRRQIEAENGPIAHQFVSQCVALRAGLMRRATFKTVDKKREMTQNGTSRMTYKVKTNHEAVRSLIELITEAQTEVRDHAMKIELDGLQKLIDSWTERIRDFDLSQTSIIEMSPATLREYEEASTQGSGSSDSWFLGGSAAVGPGGIMDTIAAEKKFQAGVSSVLAKAGNLIAKPNPRATPDAENTWVYHKL